MKFGSIVSKSQRTMYEKKCPISGHFALFACLTKRLACDKHSVLRFIGAPYGQEGKKRSNQATPEAGVAEFIPGRSLFSFFSLLLPAAFAVLRTAAVQKLEAFYRPRCSAGTGAEPARFLR